MSSVLFDEVTLLHPFSRLYISCHHYNWWSQRRFIFVRLHTLNKISPRKRDFHVLPIWARSYQFIVNVEEFLSHNFIQNIKELSPSSHKDFPQLSCSAIPSLKSVRMEEGKIFATCLSVAGIQWTVSGFSPLETPAPLMILPLLIKIFNNGGGCSRGRYRQIYFSVILVNVCSRVLPTGEGTATSSSSSSSSIISVII